MKITLRIRANKFLANLTSFYRFMIRRHIRQFSYRLGHRSLVLDLGCGLDSPYQHLIDKDLYIGVDLFEPAHVQADISQLPFPLACADLVLCTEVLEHVPSPAQVLSEILRVLQPGGYLILTVPFLWGEHDYVDYQRWTSTGLKKILSETGFTILQFHLRGGIFSSVGSLLALIPYQVFSPLQSRFPLLYFALMLLSLPFSLLFSWILAPFDLLDRSRRFLLGFDLLCQVNPCPPPPAGEPAPASSEGVP